tara:strand:+ start:3255 stop:4289 length:1035 start_codon:yes stop_codon:yes gene_type:complete
MANGDTTASRLGLVNNTGTAVDALFLKVFSGEILTTFEEFNVMKGLHTMRTIANGKSAQFPVTGIADAQYHTPGQNIADAANGYLSQIKHAEKVINIDDVLVASTFIANIDELKNHYDVRSIYAQELGKALAKRFDLATMKTLAAAARSAATITGGKAGIQVDSNSGGVGALSGTEIQAALFTAAQRLDENDIPDDGQRFAILKPKDYYTLISSGEEVVNRDFGGRGDVASGRIPMVAGINLYKSNHLSDVAADLTSVTTGDGSASVKNDVFGGTSYGEGYNGNLVATEIIGGHPSAIGTVKLLDLATESDYKVELQGSLFVAKYAMGHGILRPEAAFEITDAT